MPVALTEEQALHALLRVAFVDEVCEFGVYSVILLGDVLEVDLVELLPVLEHFLEFGIAISVSFHLLVVGRKLRFAIFELLF